MKLKTKVIATSVCMLSLSTMGLGALFTTVTYQQGMANLGLELDELVSLVSEDPDPLSAALFEFDGLSLNVEYKDADGVSTMLQETFIQNNPADYISRELDLGFDETLVISKSTKSITGLVQGLIPLVLGMSAVMALAGALVLYFALSNDVRAIGNLSKFAKNKSEGKDTKFTTTRVSAEIDQLSEALAEMVESLEKNQANLRHFLSDSSHELKTPLTVIRGYIEILQQQTTDSMALEKLGKVHREAMKMQELVADLLLLSEIESESALGTSGFSLGELVAEVIETQQLLAPDRKFNSKVSDEVFIEADRTLIERYLTNALSNVRLHTPPNVTALVSAEVLGEKVTIVVEDDGPGLSDSLSSSIETRFHPNRNKGGTGLGLSIMKGIVQKHGGEIYFSRSELGGLKVSATLKKG